MAFGKVSCVGYEAAGVGSFEVRLEGKEGRKVTTWRQLEELP